MKIRIIYEDNHLLIVEKPVNIPVQGDNTNDTDLLSILKQDLKERYNKPGEAYLGLVHRLDRPVGGIMVFAKTSKAASRLSEKIRTRIFKKTYLTVVRGKPGKNSDTLVNYLLKNTETNTVLVVRDGTKDAKEAILDYEVIKANGSLSMLKIRLHTGRPHQIRVQLSYIGHPIYGDQKYGAQVNEIGQLIALWAYSISFIHPVTKEELAFLCEPPDKYPWNEMRE
jgi:23S rRNA pseudouridine1911/1915/1917 synthase